MESEHQNLFDLWNEQKKLVNSRNSVFCNIREIWWCTLGLNIGSEQNGKNDIFERPVLIIKVFNKNICRIIPLTSKLREDKYHSIIHFEKQTSCIIFSQMKTLSTKRFTRKIGRLDEVEFENIVEKLKNSL
jgi:mRNA-degrading endonuclease toxin of MazEF toxin-antitoxin module